MAELPTEVIDTAERLTRLARRAVDENEAAAYLRERDETLAEYGYVARVREEEPRTVLVCHPDEWLEEGTVRTERIEDIDRAVERPLEGPGEEGDYERVERHNRRIVAEIEETAGNPHGANADAFADFMSNHYVRRVESASVNELREFLTEYYPRNAWPSDEQRNQIEDSLRLVFETTDSSVPALLREETGGSSFELSPEK